MRWSMVMSVTSRMSGFVERSAVRTAILRMMAIAIADYGVHSCFVLDLGSRLKAEITMGFGDFSLATLGFFIHIESIIGLYSW